MTAPAISISERDLRRLLALGAPVGSEGRNRREDVARLELLLGLAGAHDLDATDGPTGFFGQRLDRAIRRFQKRHGLAIDGVVNPNGETMSALAETMAAGAPVPDENPASPAPGWPWDGPSEPPDETVPEPSIWEKIFDRLTAHRRAQEFEWMTKMPATGGVANRQRW